jgi:predicted permease
MRWRRRFELNQEILDHIDEKTANLVESGLPEHQARQRARREFGNPTLLTESSREVWGWTWLDRLRQDLRYALRQMRRGPAFTAVAVLSLALGIGANTAIFTVIDALLLKSLPVQQPEQLVKFSGTILPDIKIDILSSAAFAGIRRQEAIFSDVAAVCATNRANLSVDGAEPDPGQVRIALVSGNYFSMLGVNTLLGRTLTLDDDRLPGGHPVAVISYGYWERRFGLQAGALRKTLRLNGITYSILGVTPRGFIGEAIGSPTDIWIPMAMQSQVMPDRPGLLTNPNAGWLRIIARLRPGVSPAQASAAAQFKAEPAAKGYSPERDQLKEPLLILLIVVSLVLLIACANVANLLLARSAVRQREMAVRLSLGAGRARIVRQLLTESLLLAVFAGAFGLLLARWGTGQLARMVSSGLAVIDLDLHPDARVFTFAALLSLVTGLLFGLAPAISASSLNPSVRLKGDAPAPARWFSAGKLLVMAQVAISLVLLIGSILFVRTLRNLKSQDMGFDRQNVLMIWTSPRQSGYRGAKVAEMFHAAPERIRTLPGVLSVGPSTFGLLRGGGGSPITVPGRARRQSDEPYVAWNLVGPGFLNSVGMKLLAGRDFTERDNENYMDVAIINESMAVRYFGRRDPVGASFGMRNGAEGSEIQIVGVVRNAKYYSPRESDSSMIYLPYRQDVFRLDSLCLAVRTVGNLPGLTARIRDELRSMDASLPVLSIDTMEQDVDKTLVQERLVAWLSGFFGTLAVLLACLGLYGVMSHAAARRTNEIAVRLALGARRSDILGMVLRESFRLVAVGITLGIPAALIVTRGVSKLLYGLKPTDPATMIIGAALMLAVAAAAAFLPARRAAKVDAMVALRHE